VVTSRRIVSVSAPVIRDNLNKLCIRSDLCGGDRCQGVVRDDALDWDFPICQTEQWLQR
jgi:hypothetical protein